VSERIKVIYLIGTLDVGGAERQLVELVKGLDRTRFEPVVYTLGPPKGNILAPEVEALDIPVKTLGLVPRGYPIIHPLGWIRITGNLLRLARMRRVFKTEQAQIFHGYLFWAYVFGGHAARVAGIPIIITSRRSLATSKVASWKGYHRWLEKRINRITDHVVTNSKAVLEDTIEQEHIPREQVSIIYNGAFQAHEPLTETERSEALQKWRRSPDEVLIVMVANLIRYKGHRYLLEALAALKSASTQPFRMIMIGGDGNAREELEQQVQELGLEDDALFAGSIPRAQRLLPLFDISVLASLEEGFSNTVLESMGAGLPMLATAVGGNGEAVVEGETGFLVPARDAEALRARLQRLMDDAELRKSMGAAGRGRVQSEFSVEAMVQKTQALYSDLCMRKNI